MKDDLTQSQVRELLNYDPETGIFIWRVDRIGGKGNVVKAAGSVAGYTWTRGTNSYRYIMISGRYYRAHRLAWFYVHGRWPTRGIDHVDCDGLNNRWVNLREANQSQNGANQRLRCNNTSGVKGVSWLAARGKWRATIKIASRDRYLGYFDTIEAAAAAYEAAAIKHFGEFART